MKFKSFSILLGVVLLSVLGYGFVEKSRAQVNFKCLVQLTNYAGEGAYVVVSLINPQGKYEKTLTIFGNEEKWFDDLKSWWAFTSVKKERLDGLSGASITAGSRKIASFNFDETKINAGYKLRFETAVENQKYIEKDLEFDLTTANFNLNKAGTEYIRYVKLIKI